MSYCMVIDLKRCVSCNACSTVCKSEHGTPPGNSRARVMRQEIGKYPDVQRLSIPMLCMQCEDPACVPVCPTGASVKQADGVVTVDKEKCIGCRACMVACPYMARQYRESEDGYFGPQLTPYEELKYKAHPKGVVDKCDFCRDNRLAQGLRPVCVENCITDARTFGTREELEGLIVRRKGYRLRAELGTGPSVYFLP